MAAAPDWEAIYRAWLSGEAPEALARRHGVKPATIKQRCGWLDKVFPPSESGRLMARALRLIEQALDAAEAGDWKRAGRILAFVNTLTGRLAQLEKQTMTRHSRKAAETRTASRDAPEHHARPGSAEHKQLVAEFEARLDALSRSIGMGPYRAGGEGGEETA
ncbi:hypothetical protein F1654_04660 [Alkalicaulis satelles]|uniref:Uncharacterized protein n=1 Tax=Alkalicaulis satelles TaxID=2609175 RepID=A0A5M6ZKC2_9PROT|nr:hypothetical protein [Alkalicaulis satelles]KAA5805276.1 hypothetical protein F1654_04660 [Alkalicaulis satelles]